MFNHVSRISLATAALVLGGTQGALALEPEAFADRLVEFSRFLGIPFSYGAATLDGDTVTLTDFTIAIPGETDIEIDGSVVFEGVAETPDGGFTATRATVADFEYTDEEDGVSVSFVDIAAEGIALPPEVNIDTLIDYSFELYDRIVAGPLRVSDAEGEELFVIDLFEAWNEEAEDGGWGSGFAINGIRFDLSGLDDPEAQAVIEAFDIAEFSAEMTGYGIWWPESGRVVLDDFAFVLNDLGGLHVNGEVGGYTREFYEDLLRVNLKMSELAESGLEIDEDTLHQIDEAMLSSLARLELVRGAVRYEDNSLFYKVLDYIGAEQGVDGETFAAGLKFLVPMALLEVDDAELRTMITQAVNAFIDDPQTFEIAIEPDEPITFSDFEALDIEADPFILVDLLNVRVTANQ